MNAKLGKQVEIVEKSLSETLLTFYPDLNRYCLWLTKNKWDAEDLLQETMIKIFDKTEKKVIKQINLTFLCKTAYYHWLDTLKKNSRESLQEIPEKNSDQIGIEDELEPLFERLFTRLTVKQLTAFLLKDYFGYKNNEIAEILSIQEGAVKTLLHRARTQVRKEFFDEENGRLNRWNKTENDHFYKQCFESIKKQNPFILISIYKQQIYQSPVMIYSKSKMPKKEFQPYSKLHSFMKCAA
ncbi:RNA polymerase sigma factor [Metabacillus arenae]|uniref:Sigma-70 family RNA polymerase sigma factor n=1 Tax=Metabacillus arenae TaxID=2771434 RepID=A0A926RWT2_9BACI|nr:sigma-70 family RNA polymerase sigma factor [Metabacillus arenae]MBD1381138.1 sigma-70 family RNA polymerase sigma factor [Metabacillus arenae]